MTWKRKAAVGAIMGLTGKQAIAAAVTVGATAIGAAAVGQDPILWGLGAFGGAVAYAHKRTAPKMVSLSNFGVSLLLGGMGSTAIANQIAVYAEASGEKTGLVPFLLSMGSSPYLLALVLPSAWPIVVPFAWEQLKGLAAKFIGAKKDE